MTITCPACRAENSERTCRRCKADLGMLFDLESQRDALLAGGFRRLMTDPGQSLTAARAANELRSGPDATRLVACAQLLMKDFVAAHATWTAVQAK